MCTIYTLSRVNTTELLSELRTLSRFTDVEPPELCEFCFIGGATKSMKTIPYLLVSVQANVIYKSNDRYTLSITVAVSLSTHGRRDIKII